MRKKQIVIATGNRGKLEEFKYIIGPYFENLLSTLDFNDIPEIAETGKTFHENALIKAKAVSEYLGVDTIADDSGLLVDALDGAPGVYSARYAGQNATDEQNVEKLLGALDGSENRKAKFVCVIVYYRVDGEPVLFTGECKGLITNRKMGENGFGYDPVFFVEEYGKTMAELPSEVKNRISHRADALNKLVEFLKES